MFENRWLRSGGAVARHVGRIASLRLYKGYAVQGWGCLGVDVGEAVTLLP